MFLTTRDVAKIERWKKHQVNPIDDTWKKFAKMGRIVDGRHHLQNLDDVDGVWQDEPCFVIGSSPGLTGLDVEKMRGCHTIAVNHLIEDFDWFEWFLFIDKQFTDITTYDLTKFKGRIFASNQTGYFDKENVTVFDFNAKEPQGSIKQGLYRGSLSGLCAVSLAIAAGANPIYMVGLDSGGVTDVRTNSHYKKDYTGAKIVNAKKHKLKYDKMLDFWNNFKGYRDRIINVDKKGKIGTFRKMDYSEIDFDKIKKVIPRICHIQTLDMERMGEITRLIYERSYGDHIWHNVTESNKVPHADIYIIHCFINHREKFIDFKKPEGSKVISIIHSSAECRPAECSDVVVSLTEHQKNVLVLQGYESVVINAGIDIPDVEVDYSTKTFGRITRNAKGKFHKDWDKTVNEILDNVKGSECVLYVDKPGENERIKYDTSIKINNRKEKYEKLAKLSLCVIANGGFKEIFPLALLESMAVGLPIIMLCEGSQNEVLDGAGIVVSDMKSLKDEVINLLGDTERKKELGILAKKKAMSYNIYRMIKSYDKEIKDLWKE